MAKLRWREILADDGTNDGWETANGRWVISSTRHVASGAVDYWFERCPMLETEERRDEVEVLEPRPVVDVKRDADGQAIVDNPVYDDDGQLVGGDLVYEPVLDADGKPVTIPGPVLDADGKPVVNVTVWHEVVRDERPHGSSDVDELKRVAQAYEDSPKEYAKLEGERKAAREQRRGVVMAQRESAKAAETIAAVISDDDLLAALAEALQARGDG